MTMIAKQKAGKPIVEEEKVNGPGLHILFDIFPMFNLIFKLAWQKLIRN